MRPARSIFLVLCVASAASAQEDAGVFPSVDPLDTVSGRVEGLVGGAPDAGPLPRSLAEYRGQPLVVYRLRCPDCPELERTAFNVPLALADTGIPVVLLLGTKSSTKAAAQKLLAKSPSNLRIAWGKKLSGPGFYGDVWFYGADGQPRCALSVYSDADTWALQTAAEKLLAEANLPLPVRKQRVRVGEPLPAGLVEGLLGGAADGGTPGPATLDGYLGQPHVVFLACPACGGATDLQALLPIAAEYKLPVVALVSHQRSTREDAETLAKQLGPRPGVRIGWGSQLTPQTLRFMASTALLVDKRGIVRLSVQLSESERATSAWLLRAGLERLQKEK